MTSTEVAHGIPELLYHTTLTVIDYKDDTSGFTQTVYVLGTHSTLSAAKAFSKSALHELGYEPDDFTTYAVRGAEEENEWLHGDGVLVYAKAPAGHEFLVGIQTTSNNEELGATPEGGVFLAPEADLHYVLQTTVDYNKDRTGAAQATHVEGSYEHRADAIDAAKQSLVGEEVKKSDFAQYDERDSIEEDSDWPFGEDVVVHAVAQTGENYTVAVRTVPGAHKKHAKHSTK